MDGRSMDDGGLRVFLKGGKDIGGSPTNCTKGAGSGEFQALLDRLGEVHRRDVARLEAEVLRLGYSSPSPQERVPLKPDKPPQMPKVTRSPSRPAEISTAGEMDKENGEDRVAPRPSLATQNSLCSLGSPGGTRRFKLREAWEAKQLETLVDGYDMFDSPTANNLKMCAKTAANNTASSSKWRCRMINPFSTYKLCWDLIGLAFIVFDMVMIPLQAFEMEDTPFSIGSNWAALIFWTFDAILSFCVGYVHKGEMIMSPRRAICRHLRTWFILDVLVIGPDWLLIIAGAGGSSEASIVKTLRGMRILRAIRILRLLRLLRLQRIMHALYDSIDSEYMFIIVGLTKLLLYVVMLNHIIACLWYYIGFYNLQNGEVNWIMHAGYQPVYQQTLGWKYSTALHWSLTQFTPASMDVSARNVLERVFSIIVLFSAMVVFSSIVGSITNSMTSIRNLSSEKQKQFWLLRLYLKQHKIPFDVRTRITKYLEYTIDKPSQVHETSVKLLPMLSPLLKMQLTYEVRIRHLQCHPFFNHLDTEFKPVAIDICHRGVLGTLAAGQDVIFRNGDEAKEMRFVCNGEVKYQPCTVGLGPIEEPSSPTYSIGSRDNSAQQSTAIKWLSEPVLWMSWRHCGLLAASTPSEILSVQPGPFAEAIRVHPRSWIYAQCYAQQFLDFIRSQPISLLTDILDDEAFHLENVNPPC